MPFTLALPGAHNILNASAAACAASAFGVSFGSASTALATFRGVFRRMQRVGECRGISVVDDYAHNPDKIRAAILAAQLGEGGCAAGQLSR